MEFTETKRKLFQLADKTVDKMKQHIKRGGKYNTGALYNSVGWKVIQGGIEFYVNDKYASFIISGRRKGAKQPPSWAIREWFSTPHGSRAFANMKKKWPKIKLEGASFIVCRSIKEKGIKPFDFYNPYIEQLYKVEAFHELESAFVMDVEKELKKTIK